MKICGIDCVPILPIMPVLLLSTLMFLAIALTGYSSALSKLPSVLPHPGNLKVTTILTFLI
jgi:hypothetical protein